MLSEKMQENIKTFMIRAGVKIDDDPETQDMKVLDYVSKMKRNFHKVYLDERQQQDHEFWLKLYDANPSMLDYRKPKSGEDDVEFMMDFVTKKLKWETAKKTNCIDRYLHFRKLRTLNWKELVTEDDLFRVLKIYYNMMQQPEFVNWLQEEFSHLDIQKVADAVVEYKAKGDEEECHGTVLYSGRLDIFPQEGAEIRIPLGDTQTFEEAQEESGEMFLLSNESEETERE